MVYDHNESRVPSMVIGLIISLFISAAITYLIFSSINDYKTNKEMEAYIQKGMFPNEDVFIKEIEKGKYAVKGKYIDDIIKIKEESNGKYLEVNRGD